MHQKCFSCLLGDAQFNNHKCSLAFVGKFKEDLVKPSPKHILKVPENTEL